MPQMQIPGERRWSSKLSIRKVTSGHSIQLQSLELHVSEIKMIVKDIAVVKKQLGRWMRKQGIEEPDDGDDDKFCDKGSPWKNETKPKNKGTSDSEWVDAEQRKQYIEPVIDLDNVRMHRVE
ncbi:uncharacterized protein LOC109804844 [Cajanus cajan]|uniref:uncharacterized protein LOC109804844 n=1 Tax=Cajanus cajan TaxID=3821 RepID=UPI00098DC429|nr:uncharacterized protein LOC109804844 [Cajanus cajan]